MKAKKTSLHFTPFKALPAPAPEKPGRSENLKTKTDRELFLEAMKDVREIKEFQAASFFPGRPKPEAPKKEKDASLNDKAIVMRHLAAIVQGKAPITLSQTGEYAEWTSPGIPSGLARRLHRGEFTVREYIDLHGMTRDEAFEAMRLFFAEARVKRTFLVKVIHGRGLRSPAGPVLKEAVRKWLEGPFRKQVLAYSSARACDGGPGATYVIIKQDAD